MTLEEYKARIKTEESWAPGWEAIDEVFEALYPGQEPVHYATDMAHRALFGGEDYLDGFSFYRSEEGYLHLLTYGMSELYGNEKSFGRDWSKWGYEMTMKLKGTDPQANLWAVGVLSNLARYTYTTKFYFEPWQYIKCKGLLEEGTGGRLAGLLAVPDTTAEGTNTVHGRVDFLQMVGLTGRELEAVMEGQLTSRELVQRMEQDSPNLVLDPKRKKEYV